MSAAPGWSWRVPDPEQNQGLGLRYEPGNWGDVLKGEWAAQLTRALAERLPAGAPLRYLDPFAGAPSYPLLEGVAARLEGLPCPAFLAGQAAFLQRGQLGSTAALVLEAARAAGRAPVAQVFDGEPRRREAWRGLEGVEVLPGQEGREALEAAGPADLLLLDPYDLFETWGALLPRARPLCREGVLLLYLFNKAPRGAGHQRQYAALRRALREAISPGQRLLVGRVASDAVLPRAFHEVLLLGPAELVSPWEAPLGQVTRALAAELASRGAWEAEGG